MTRFSMLCASTALLMPVAVYAQQITTEINGQVTDTAGGALSGATVVVTDTRTGNVRTIEASGNGLFSARNLGTGGPYTVTATAPGFQGQTVESVTTNLQGPTQLTFTLSAVSTEASEETIVVTGSRAQVSQLATGPGQSFNAEVLETAPSFNRDIRDVLRIDPRVSLDRDELSGSDRVSCLGGNDRANTFTVDGIIQADIYGLNDSPFASRSSMPIPYDAVRETQVQFAPFDVEYGQFTGCAINVVTKSGSNEFHGSAFFEYTGDSLTGSSIAGANAKPGKFSDKRWGATLGGPIIKDRLFFFGGYEESKSADTQDDGPAGAGYVNSIPGVTAADFENISNILRTTYGIDTGGLATTLPITNRRFFGRTDLYITEDHRLELTYQRLEEAAVRSDDFFATGSSPQVAGYNTFYQSGTKSNYYSGRLYSQWSDNLSTELRFSQADVIDRQDPVGGGEAQSANPIPRIIVGVQNGALRGAIVAGPGNSRSANDLQTHVNQYKAKADFTAGNHDFTAGVELNRARVFNLFVQNATGTLVFRNAADLAAGLLSPGTGNNQTSTSSSANIANGVVEGAFGNFSATGDVNDAAASFTRSIYSMYAQDDWRVSDQLSFVLGARIDWFDGSHPEYNPNFVRRYGFSNTTGFSNLAPVLMPRAAFTYDVDEFSVFARTQIKGGVGIFSGGDPGVWFGNAFQNNGYLTSQASTQASGCPAGQIDVVVNGTFSGLPQCVVAAASASAAAGLGNTQSIDPDIKSPTVLRANIGLQTDLNLGGGFFDGWRLNLDYIWSRYRNPMTVVDLSQTPDIRTGLAGLAIDGRPIYQTIDPTRAGCSARLTDAGAPPVWTGVTAACFTTARFDELMLTNQGAYNSQIASIILSKQFDRGIFTDGGSIFFNAGYAFTDSHDRRNMYNSTAGSNYDQTAAFDRQNPDESRGYYASRHNFTLSTTFKEQFFDDYDTSFGFTFVARSGRPYSLTFGGSGAFNNSNSGFDNSLLYVPTGISDPNLSPSSNAAAVASLVDYVSNLDCAKDYAGRTIARNTCQNDWFLDMDLSFSQELPGPIKGDSIRLFATVDNFLNLLSDKWNVFRRRQFSGLVNVADSTGVDSQGRYIISSGFRDDAELIQTSSSLWRLKVGVSYKF